MKKYEITIENVTTLDEALKELDQYIDELGDVAIDDVISLKGIDIKPIAWYNIVVGVVA